VGILIDAATRVVVQGITGREATSMSREMLDYGTRVVAGVTPGKGGERVHGVPVYDVMRDAHRLGYKSSFTIYDEADANRLVGYVLRDLNLDPKKLPPRAVHGLISAAKNDLIDFETYAAQARNGDSLVPVAAGETISERKALDALLLPSADNMAWILARWDAGSQAAMYLRLDGLLPPTAKEPGMEWRGS